MITNILKYFQGIRYYSHLEYGTRIFVVIEARTVLLGSTFLGNPGGFERSLDTRTITNLLSALRALSPSVILKVAPGILCPSSTCCYYP